MLTAVLSFAVAATLIVLLPGPDTLVVLRALVRGGRGLAARTVLGVLTGLSLWVLAAALGLSAVLRASEQAYAVLRWVGAAYLVWLGVQSLRSRSRSVPVAGDGGLRSGYLAGLLTDLLNPKVGVFFVTFLPGFVPEGASVGWTSALFGGLFVLLTAVYFALVLGLAGRVTLWLAAPAVRRRMDRLTGVVLVGFGVRLVTEG